VKVVRIEQKYRFAVGIPSCGHSQLDIFVFNIFLLIIHSVKKNPCQGELMGKNIHKVSATERYRRRNWVRYLTALINCRRIIE